MNGLGRDSVSGHREREGQGRLPDRQWVDDAGGKWENWGKQI